MIFSHILFSQITELLCIQNIKVLEHNFSGRMLYD